MREVKVRTSVVLDKIQTNRDQHRGQYEKAVAGWKRDVIRSLEENLQALKSGARNRVIITDAPPEDHTRDYDRVIEMIKMSADDTVTLDHMSFRQYVLDDWQWKEEWATVNSKYLASDIENPRPR